MGAWNRPWTARSSLGPMCRSARLPASLKVTMREPTDSTLTPSCDGRPPSPAPAPYRGPERRASHPPLQRWLGLLVDEIDYGMVLLSDDAQVMHVNHLARLALEAEHPLELRGRGIYAKRAQDIMDLAGALSAAAQRGRRCLLKLGDSRHTAMVSVVPLGQLGHGEPAIALIFGKRQVCEPLSVESFARAYRLTAAEAKVLGALCNGMRVNEVARRHGVETSTVRSQVSSIRHKTGAESIATLVRQVAVLPPLLGVLRSPSPDPG
jgi:DNA-binding CsgD family transcriptional regulator